MMDQKPIVYYIRMKGMPLDAIHDDVVRTLGKGSVTYSTVTKYARSAQFSGRKEATSPEAPDVGCSLVDEAILMDLAEFPFSSVREDLSSEIHRAPAPAPHAITSLHGAISSMGPPLLDGGTEADSGPDGNRTITGPLGDSTRQWHDIVTLDESWIYLFSEPDLIWTAPREIVVDRERHTVQSPKFLLTVMWNPIGFHVLKALPKGRKFNAQYYTNDILAAISDWRRKTWGTRPNKLWVHSDNARPHTARMLRDYTGLSQMKQARHAPYSPDLAP
jgi:hypothetical protein